MISGIGIDIEDIERFKKPYKDKNFLDLIYHQNEIEYCKKKKQPFISFAGRFCLKEAIIKALKGEYNMKEIEIRNQPKRKIKVFLKNKEQKNIHCSVSYGRRYAVGLAIVEGGQ